jgi:hypothetical protein
MTSSVVCDRPVLAVLVTLAALLQAAKSKETTMMVVMREVRRVFMLAP